MLTKLEFSDVAKRLMELCDAYERKPFSLGALDIWWQVVKTCTQGEVLGALDDWAKSKQRMPTPAAILERIVARRPRPVYVPKALDVDAEKAYDEGVERRWVQHWAPKYGLDPKLSGKARYDAMEKAIGKPHRRAIGEVNLAHMNALIDAVESGHPEGWRRHPVSPEELAAAYRATGRKPREPGEDREEP